MIRLLKPFICAAAFFSAVSVTAQHQINFSVTDSTSTPESFATVRIFLLPDSVKALKIATTDVDGNFSEKVDSTGDYRITVSSLGKATYLINTRIERDTNLGTIILRATSTVLDAVDVVAQRPLVTTEIDRFIYDIKADEESKTSNIFDMLRKVPMVTVDGDDEIKVKGQSNFRIFKNGRPNTQWEKNPKEVLKSIPASMIKRIEVITEPGAKYDAEGVDGILNIVTDDDVTAKGVMGSITGNVNERGGTGGWGYLTAQYDKLVLSVNLGMYYQPEYASKTKEHSETHYKEAGDRMISFANPHDRRNTVLNCNFGFEASYEIDSLNLITAEFHGWFMPKFTSNAYQYSQYLNAADNLVYSYTTHTYFPYFKYNNFGGKLDYQRFTNCKDETITFSYMIDGNGNNTESESDYIDITGNPNFDYTQYLSRNNQRSIENTFQLDWSRPFLKYNRIDAGLKYILRDNSSNTEQRYSLSDNPTWVSSNNKYEEFKHQAHIASAYAEYAYNSAKFGARAGIRYEFAYNNVKYPLGNNPNFSHHVGDVVPTFSGSWKLNDANTFKINFATRVRRPSIYYLNPALVKSPTTASQGNPDLVSARHHNSSITYSLMRPKIMISANAAFSFANNTIMDYSYAENGIIWTKYGNIGRTRNASLSSYIQYRPSSNTTFMLNGGIDYAYLKRPGTNEKNDGLGWRMYANISQKIFWNINLNCFGGYFVQTPYSLYTKKSYDYYYYGISLSKSWLKEDRLTARLNVNTPFPVWRSVSFSSDTPSYATSNDYSTYSSKVSISVSYRFGSLNAYVKKARKSISNDDVQSGGGNNAGGSSTQVQ